jgi:hypothetical protein
VASLEPGTPAVLVVWEKGEVKILLESNPCIFLKPFPQDYEYILGRYAAEWEMLNAEVKLAVAIGHKTLDTEAADDFCSEVGFEFVDAGDGEDDESESQSASLCETLF